jgi:hypothetical protein
MCTCGEQKIYESNKTICTSCGLEQPLLENHDHHESFEDVNTCVYSRRKRFEHLIDSVLYPAFHQKDVPVFKMLKDKKFKTIGELVTFMRHTPLKDKRFCSIHLFATLTVQKHKTLQPPPYTYRTHLLRLFDEVLSRHKVYGGKQFFSYPWLLRRLILLTGNTQYEPYIKEIRCKRRRKKYNEMLHTLFTGLCHGYTLTKFLGDVETSP